MDPIQRYNLEQQERMGQTIDTLRRIAAWAIIALVACAVAIWLW